MSTVYDDFENAWVDRCYSGNIDSASRLAVARRRMKAHPDYDVRKYVEAVFRAERTVVALRALMP
jgi:hypothetical protein